VRAPLHPAIDARCPRCEGQGYVVRREGELALAVRCACVGACPHCRDTGWVASGTGFRAPRKRCDCQRLAARLQRFDQIGIPGRHAASTRRSFQMAGKAQVSAMQKITGWLGGFQKGGDNRGLVLHGDVGRGKTHLLVAMLRELVLDHGVTARFIEFSHLLADMKYGFDRGEGSGARMEELVACDVLGIDELGKGRNTEFEGTVLDELVSRRYNAGRVILATTNYAPTSSTGRAVGDLTSGELPSLVDRVGARVFSRLREICEFVPVTGDDWRVRIATDSSGSGTPAPAARRLTTSRG
jgi:DNA replication protein DnaC